MTTTGLSGPQVRMFLLLYLCYATYYLPRKAVSIAKPFLEEEMGLSRVQLGGLDSAYLASYTLSVFASGALAARVPANFFLFLGLMGCALCNVLICFAVSPWSFWVIGILHGAFQATGWPTCVKLLSEWLPTENRGTIMGFWTTCQSVGGIAGACMATYLAAASGWRAAFAFEVPLLSAVALALLLFVRERPAAAGNAVQTIQQHGSRCVIIDSTKEKLTRRPPSFAEILAIPKVKGVACAYFFLKFLRYALLMWLPYYYQDALRYSPGLAGYMSVSFEIGGVIGTPFIGFVSDRLLGGRRDVTATLFMMAAAVVMACCCVFAEAGTVFNFSCMTLVGVLVIGPDSVLSGTIAQDIAAASGHGSDVVATLAGFFNGVGSAGAILQGVATAYVTKTYGWRALFALLVACCAISAGILGSASAEAGPAGRQLPPKGLTTGSRSASGRGGRRWLGLAMLMPVLVLLCSGARLLWQTPAPPPAQ